MAQSRGRAAEKRRQRGAAPAGLSVRLTSLAEGRRARLDSTELPADDRALLSALGLGRGSSFRICRAGDPWIVEVRSTRIGLADDVAAQLLVCPEPVP